MRRRELLKAAAAGAAALAAPRIGRAERTSKLVFVPTSDLSLLDPVVTPFRVQGRDAKGNRVVVERSGPIKIVSARR